SIGDVNERTGIGGIPCRRLAIRHRSSPRNPHRKDGEGWTAVRSIHFAFHNGQIPTLQGVANVRAGGQSGKSQRPFVALLAALLILVGGLPPLAAAAPTALDANEMIGGLQWMADTRVTDST